MNKTQLQEGKKKMAELKFCRNETLGEISLLGKLANKSRSAKNCKPSDECLTIPTKYFEEKNVKPFTKENKNTFTLISPQNTLWRAN